MESITSSLLISPKPPLLRPHFKTQSIKPTSFRVSASASASSSNPNLTPITRSLRSAASAALILAAASASLFSSTRPAVANPIPETVTESTETDAGSSVDLSSETVASLKSLVFQKLDEGEDSEALALLNRLISLQPSEPQWKFLAARVLSEMGEAAEARKLYEEILATDPLSFEALFENAVLMDRCGEGEAVIQRLEKALEMARAEQRDKSARDVRFIMAQIKYLQKNVEEALEDYEELSREDPGDYRPYFCQGVILSLLERKKEARDKFAKYKELAPGKFEVDAYLQTPLSRAKLFGTEDSEISSP